jgi:putative hydrolase of the HAD superfamily
VSGNDAPRGRIRGVFFDLGGTLYSYRNIGTASAAMVRELAARLERDHDELLAHYRQAARDADLSYAARPFFLFRDYFLTIFENLRARIGYPGLGAHAAWFGQQHNEGLAGSLELRPDCHATLERLKSAGFYVSVVSNSDADMLRVLIERGGLERHLDDWTSSEEARSCKPDRRFFEVALAKSGLAAEQVLFVGDSLEQDIHGAHAAGMTTVLVTELDGEAPMHVGRAGAEPDFRVSALAEVPAIVRAL